MSLDATFPLNNVSVGLDFRFHSVKVLLCDECVCKAFSFVMNVCVRLAVAILVFPLL